MVFVVNKFVHMYERFILIMNGNADSVILIADSVILEDMIRYVHMQPLEASCYERPGG